MLDNYVLAKKLVSNKYGDNCKNYEILVLGLYALLCKYNDNKYVVINVFKKTNIHIENDTLRNIVKKHNIKMIDFDEEEENISNSDFSSTGISSNGEEIEIDVNDGIFLEETEPFVACSTLNRPIEEVINTFIHEMNHIVKCQINGFGIDEESDEAIQCHIRSGLNFYHFLYMKPEDCLYKIDYFNILDEVINTIETTEMMDFILSLDGIVDDKMQSFISGLDLKLLTMDYGYEDCVKIIRRLWANKKFKSLIEDNILFGNIDLIISEFDSVLGDGAFEKMADLLDDLDDFLSVSYDDESDSKKMSFKQVKNKLRIIINSYNKNTNFVYKKQ